LLKRARSVKALCGAASQIFLTETSCGASAAKRGAEPQMNTEPHRDRKIEDRKIRGNAIFLSFCLRLTVE
jgi:hypothetical protein